MAHNYYLFIAKKFKLFFRKPEIPVVVVAVVITIIIIVIRIILIFLKHSENVRRSFQNET